MRSIYTPEVNGPKPPEMGACPGAGEFKDRCRRPVLAGKVCLRCRAQAQLTSSPSALRDQDRALAYPTDPPC